MKYNTCYLKIRKEKENLYLASNQDFELHFFNETIAQILFCIKNDFCKNEIINYFKNVYDVNAVQLEKDITKAIDYLIDNKFIYRKGDVTCV